jgi:hypothetical protein
MKQTLIYDINVLPNESTLTVDKVMEIYQTERILFWDSRGATPGIDCVPKIYDLPEDMTITIVEINSKEGKALLKTFR